MFGDVIVIDHVAGGAEGVCGGLQSVCEEEREGASAGGQGEPSVTIWHRESMVRHEWHTHTHTHTLS